MAGFLPEHLPIEAPWLSSLHIDRASILGTPNRERSISSPATQSSKRRSILDSFRPSKRQRQTPPGYSIFQAPGSVDSLTWRYRCEILSTSSSDYREAEDECKQLVIEAGGNILDQRYPGGFLFELSCLNDVPIETGDKTAHGSTIVVELCGSSLAHQEQPAFQQSPTHLRVSRTKRLQKKRPQVQQQAQEHPFEVGFNYRGFTLQEMLEEGRLDKTDDWALIDGEPCRTSEDDWKTIYEEC